MQNPAFLKKKVSVAVPLDGCFTVRRVCHDEPTSTECCLNWNDLDFCGLLVKAGTFKPAFAIVAAYPWERFVAMSSR